MGEWIGPVIGGTGGGGGGSGTVTSFSFTDANGIHGVVTNPTTTPNLTLSFSPAGTARAALRVPVLASVQAASDVSIGNVNIAAPGASLDGFTFLSSGFDTFLLTAQTNPVQNGPWVWNGPATPATRPTDWASGYVATTGRFLAVQNGTNNLDTLWLINVPSAGITVDTSSQTWVSLNILPNLFNEQVIRSQPLNQMTPPTATVTFNGQDIVGIASESYFDGTAAHGAINITLNSPLIGMLANSTDTLSALQLGLISGNPSLTFAPNNSAVDWSLARTGTTVATITGALVINAAGAVATGLAITAFPSSVVNALTITQAVANNRAQFLLNNNAAVSTGNISSFGLQGTTSTTTRTIFQFDTNFSTTTDASRTSTVKFNTANAGAFGAAITIVGNATTFAGAVGFNGAAAQTAFASGGAAPAGGTGTAAGGYDTAAHRDALITLVNNIRTALVNNGIMS